MAFFFLCLTIFIMFFQPGKIFPGVEQFQPLRNCAILALVSYAFSKEKGKHGFFRSKTNVFFIFFVITQIVSSGMQWAGGALDTFNLWLKMGIVYYLITQIVNTEKRLKWISFSVISGLLYLSYFSISQFVMTYQPGMRAGGFGWYENANDLAIILVAAIPIVILLANLSEIFVSKYFYYLIVAGIFGFNILFTGSRNGLLGLMAVGGVSLLFSKNLSKALRIVLLLIMVAGVFTVGLKNVLSRNDLSGLHGDSSSEDRILQWRACGRMVMDKPFFGIGPGNFDDRAADYGGIRSLEPHNTLFQVFAEAGILGGIAFTLFSFYPLYFTYVLNKRTPENNELTRKFMLYQIVSASLVGFWVCAFFTNRYQFYILYVVIAMSQAIKSNIINEPDKKGLNG